jgi:hypothetical protein
MKLEYDTSTRELVGGRLTVHRSRLGRRRHAGSQLAAILVDSRLTCQVYASAAAALATGCDVFVEYTKPDTAKANGETGAGWRADLPR